MLVNKKLSVIIVNYKSEPFLKECLVSLYNNTKRLSLEIIVVNNDKKNVLEKIKKIFPEVQVIEKNENIGFSRAVNLATQLISNEILFILNPDTRIISNNIENILLEFDKNKGIGIIGSQIINLSGVVQSWSAGTKKTIWDLIKNNLGFIKSKKLWKSRKKIEVDWVAGTAMFIRKSLFLSLRGFDEKFFMYFEDVDICQRAKKLGKKVLYYPYFTVKHFSGRSFKNEKIQKKYYYDAQEYYFQKHGKKIENIIVKILRKIFFN